MHCTIIERYCILTIRSDVMKFDLCVWLLRLQCAKRPQSHNLTSSVHSCHCFRAVACCEYTLPLRKQTPTFNTLHCCHVLGAVERADGKVFVTYFRGHSYWAFIVVKYIDGCGYSKKECPIGFTLCNNYDWRVRVDVSYFCIMYLNNAPLLYNMTPNNSADTSGSYKGTSVNYITVHSCSSK